MQQEERSESLEDKIIQSHKKYLEAIKEVYYLAILSSLSLAIASFTKDTIPSASIYAIVSASLFLCAFICSLTVRVIPDAIYTIASYICMASGVVTLILIVIEFTKAIPLANKVIVSIFYSIGIPVLVRILFGLRKTSKSESRILRLLGRTTFFVGIPFVIMSTAFFLIYFLFEALQPPYAFPIAVLIPIAVVVFFAFTILFALTSIVMITLALKTKFSKRKS